MSQPNKVLNGREDLEVFSGGLHEVSIMAISFIDIAENRDTTTPKHRDPTDGTKIRENR